VLAIDERLDEVSRNGFRDKEKPGGCHHHAPTRIDRRRQKHRKERDNDAADEGNKAREAGEDPPKHRVGDADQPQPAAITTPKSELRRFASRRSG
jgi:hypothetical protein